MNITENEKDFTKAKLDTPFNAVCVKKRGRSLQNLFDDKYGHGVLVTPTVLCGTVKSQDHLNKIVSELNPATVTVRGHGWFFETPFVWTGTVAEFNQTWTVD